MQVVKKIFAGVFVFWFALLLFMPKEELYFALEKELKNYGVVINEERIESGLLSLNLINAHVYVKGIEVAKIEKVNIFSLLFTSNINIKSLILDDSLKSFAPQHIDVANISYTVFSPMHVSIEAKGSFGALEGDVDLKTHTLRIDFTKTTAEIDIISANLKKDEKGWYYETSF